jgi:hypothetical protein
VRVRGAESHGPIRLAGLKWTVITDISYEWLWFYGIYNLSKSSEARPLEEMQCVLSIKVLVCCDLVWNDGLAGVNGIIIEIVSRK